MMVGIGSSPPATLIRMNGGEWMDGWMDGHKLSIVKTSRLSDYV